MRIGMISRDEDVLLKGRLLDASVETKLLVTSCMLHLSAFFIPHVNAFPAIQK
jgi:hypothetical protein